MRGSVCAAGIVAALLAMRVGVAGAQDLPRADAEQLGFSPERLGRITQLLRENAADGLIPGAVLLIARHHRIAYLQSVGMLDPQAATPMRDDAIFRLYSMTKPITQVAAMMLYEEGRLLLDTPIAKYLPQFANMKVAVEPSGPVAGPPAETPALRLEPAAQPILIQDLMRHTSGITYGFFGTNLVKKAYDDAGLLEGDFDNAEFVDRLAKLPLSFQPATTWDYGHSTDVLGRIVEVISGQTLSQFIHQRLLDPLGMKDTSFYVTDPAKQERIAEPFAGDRLVGPGFVIGDPRVRRKSQSGGSGLVGTAGDYARFLQMLIDGGTLDGKRYLGPKTVAYMTADHLDRVIAPGTYYLPGPGYGFGLGVAVRTHAGLAPAAGSVGDYWWGGAAATYFWVDPKADLYVVFLIQSPRRQLHYPPILRDMIYAALLN